jgi:hypothetical protein
MKAERWRISELCAFGHLDRIIQAGLDAGKAVRISGNVKWTTSAYVIDEILKIQDISCSPHSRPDLVRVGQSLRRLGLGLRHRYRSSDGSFVRPWVILEASDRRR